MRYLKLSVLPACSAAALCAGLCILVLGLLASCDSKLTVPQVDADELTPVFSTGDLDFSTVDDEGNPLEGSEDPATMTLASTLPTNPTPPPDGTIRSSVFEWISPGAPATHNRCGLRLNDNGGVDTNFRFHTADNLTIDLHARYHSGWDLAYIWNDLNSVSVGFRAFSGGIAGNGLFFRGSAVGARDISVPGLIVNFRDGNWHHIRAVLDANANTFTVYINGIVRGQVYYDGRGFTSDDRFRVMGRRTGSPTRIDYDRYVWAPIAAHDLQIPIFSELLHYELEDCAGETVANRFTKATQVVGPVELHTVDQRRPSQEAGGCPGGARNCRQVIEGAVARVFDRDDPTIGENTTQVDFPNLWVSGHHLAECTTDETGHCTLIEPGPGNYLTVVRIEDEQNIVFSGRPKSEDEFVEVEQGQWEGPDKAFQFIKLVRRDEIVQYTGAHIQVVTGSHLEVVYPDFAVWEDVKDGYVYPFIFTSDSDWTVDICARVPQGYQIVGVYDEGGEFVSGADCTQAFVAGETQVVAFDVEMVGSPEPLLSTRLLIRGPSGALNALNLDVPGLRIAQSRTRNPAGQGRGRLR